MDGVDQQAWKEPLRLRSEGRWSHGMSYVNNAGQLHRDPTDLPSGIAVPSISETLLASTSVFSAKGVQVHDGRDGIIVRDGNMEPVLLGGRQVLECWLGRAVEVPGRVDTFSSMMEKGHLRICHHAD